MEAEQGWTLPLLLQHTSHAFLQSIRRRPSRHQFQLWNYPFKTMSQLASSSPLV
jgi:hypothetical protein